MKPMLATLLATTLLTAPALSLAAQPTQKVDAMKVEYRQIAEPKTATEAMSTVSESIGVLEPIIVRPEISKADFTKVGSVAASLQTAVKLIKAEGKLKTDGLEAGVKDLTEGSKTGDAAKTRSGFDALKKAQMTLVSAKAN